MAVKRAFVSTKGDPVDSGVIGQTKWNADLTIEPGTIVNADVNAAAAIAVSKLADGTAYQLLRTGSDGSIVEWGIRLHVGTSAPANPTTDPPTLWVDTS